MSLRRQPHKARSRQGCSSWWYENRASIDVFVQDEFGHTRMARITKRAILGWLKRTKETKP